MKKKNKLITLFLTALCVASLLGGCGKGSENAVIQDAGKAPAKKNTEVTLNEVAHSIFYAPMYVAIEEGYFEEEGIDLTLVTGFGADKTMTALLTDEADIGFMGSESTIYTYIGGSSDYAVNFAQLTQRAGNFLVAREPIENFDWSMLIGKNVLGGRAGGMPEMVFEYILKKNNIDPAVDLSIDQSIDFGSTAAAFSGGQGEFTVEFEPHATSLEEKGDGYVVASLGEDSGYVPYTAFSAKKSFIEKNPETIQSFTNALQKGMNYVQSHSAEEIAKVIKPQFEETELATITTIVERYASQDTWKSDLIFEEDSFTLLQNILDEAGELEKRVPYEDLVDTSFATESSKKVRP
ncbi:MAG: ABC transporter substrate-binding protein [Lachnospiraceae bacterium]|nr:ABC transporter substrate-binding protein [Lachnospiraceae bacterium]